MQDCHDDIEESNPELFVFTRKDLQELRVATVKKEFDDATKKLAAQVRAGVLGAAMHSDSKMYCHRIGYGSMGTIPMFSETYYKVIEAALYSLSHSFPDAAIVYRRARNDIHVEWA